MEPYNNAYKQNKWNPFRKRPHFSELPDRRIISNIPDKQLPNNKIQTAKYHMATFPIVNLLEQFSKPANMYFLLIGALQLIPAVSISQGKPTMYLPLTIVVLISMLKDFVEDLKRHNSDKQENTKLVQVLGQAGFVKRKSENILVGDIVKVHKNDYFPCDMLLLQNSKESNFVYVETKNLDGETNLKQKKKHPQLLNVSNATETELLDIKLEVFYQKPNPFLYTFNGNIKLENKRLILDNSNLLLRGCSLKINQWVVGLVLYTGHDAKVMLNSTHAVPKRSGLENKMNSYFKVTFLAQVVATLLCSLVYAILNSANHIYLGYLESSNNFMLDLLMNWGTWFIIFASFVPISLLVTLELIRYFQGIVISKDPFCHYAQTDTPLSVQSSNLNQELGQIDFVLSDKTGTLTKNVMNFRFACAGGITYGQQQTLTALQMEQLPKVTNVEFADKSLFNVLKNPLHPQYPALKRYMMLLGLCHNIIPQKDEYNASSPDELALANFAKYAGFCFKGMTEDGFMELEFEGQTHQYKLLHTLQFNSDRKRMSVILKGEDGQITLMCKGADSVIENRMVADPRHKPETLKALQRYATLGFRTLMLAQKTINEEEYKEWESKYLKALASLSSNRHERIQELQSQIEKGLELVGITAIEDKLQDKVCDTIQLLQKAGIIVWMLTGDKKETAISIGYSTGLIERESEKIVLDCPEENLQALLTNLQSIMEVISANRVLIISGSTLLNLPEHLNNRIFSLAMTCRSVICCRVSPKQKAQIAELVKQIGRVLSIGDGANDVNMITKAHVGVGIKGHEGGQAARAADYVIGEFQILRQLLLNHGREIYRRNSYTILYNIFKNMLAIMPVVWFGTVSMFSGSYIYDNWLFQFYNVLFTFFPIMVFSLIDQQHSRDYAIRHPEIYIVGRKNTYFNNKVLLRNFLNCVYESAVLLVLVFGFNNNLVTTGRMMFESSSGMEVMTMIVIICNIRPLLFAYGFNVVFVTLCALGILFYFVIYVFIEFILYTDIKNTLPWQLVTVEFWILLPLCLIATEGMYVLFSRFLEFNEGVVSHGKESPLLQKEHGGVELIDTVIREIKEPDEKITSQILEASKKIYTGYAFDEDEARQNR